MMKMIGIVFSNIYDASMGDLTKRRTVASLPFGGRYRQIDFVLSNMCNSGIHKVGIITKYNYQSLMDHLATSAEWDFNTRNGGLYFIPPFVLQNNGVYRGKLEALYNAVNFLEHSTEEYVVLSDSSTICNVDFSDALESHIASGRDITIIANDEYKTGNKQYIDLVLNMNGEEVSEAAINVIPDKDDMAAMGMFIMEREYLLKIVQKSVSHGLCHLERDFIQRSFIDGDLSINLYKYDGVVLRNTDVVSFYQNNLRLLDENIRKGIFKESAPIYTKVRDEEPSYYYEGSSVKHCLIADGCKIEGTVENSIIFRDVKIEKGAIVRNSVIMQGTVISKGAVIEQAIVDKDVFVSPSRLLVGAASSPIILNKGAKV
ncbi:MAG: glucose-1-phosphate adenylyltransferase subunit GlgD [Clostridia bacterium]|nr:glucose-1-phosphate adenylyltransferase subunit GlgD [Clostridia bacterium]